MLLRELLNRKAQLFIKWDSMDFDDVPPLSQLLGRYILRFIDVDGEDLLQAASDVAAPGGPRVDRVVGGIEGGEDCSGVACLTAKHLHSSILPILPLHDNPTGELQAVLLHRHPVLRYQHQLMPRGVLGWLD